MDAPTCEKCGSDKFEFRSDGASEHMFCLLCGTEYPVLLDFDIDEDYPLGEEEF
jgi:uncharacterized Zn finger protein (UPF0148 family)